eukprot:1575417-Prymnesium_polylepis.1
MALKGPHYTQWGSGSAWEALAAKVRWVGWRRRTDRPPNVPRGRAPDAPQTTQMSVPAIVRSGSMLCRCGATQ